MSQSDGRPENGAPSPKDGRFGPANLPQLLLIASLALNMFLLGAGTVLIVRMWGKDSRPVMVSSHGPGGRGNEFPGPGFILRTLPAESRARIEANLQDQRKMTREAMVAARQARLDAFNAFAAEDYSAKLLEERLKKAHDLDLAAVDAVYDILTPVALELTPEERGLVIEAARERRQRFLRMEGAGALPGPPGAIPGAGPPPPPAGGMQFRPDEP